MAGSKVEKKKRRPNFSLEELNVLCEEVSDNKQILFDKFSDALTNEKKNKCWREVVSKVNAVSCTERNVDEVRKKWSDWSSSVKVKASKLKLETNKTGSGKICVPNLSDLEEKVIACIGKTAVDGIAGAIDWMRHVPPLGIDDPCERQSPEMIDLNLDDTRENAPRASSTEAIPFKKRKVFSTTSQGEGSETEIIKIEQQKLDIKRERLHIEQLRLSIEQRRLEVEERILPLLETHVQTSQLQTSSNMHSASGSGSYQLFNI